MDDFVFLYTYVYQEHFSLSFTLNFTVFTYFVFFLLYSYNVKSIVLILNIDIMYIQI